MGLSNDTVKAESVQLAANLSYRMALPAEGFAIVPSAGLAVGRTSVDDLMFDDGQTLVAPDYTTFSSSLGANLDYSVVSPDGRSQIRTFAGAHYHSALSAGQSMTLLDGMGGSSSVNSSGIDAYTSISLGLGYATQIDTSRSFNVKVSANFMVGKNVDGYAIGLEAGFRF